MNIVEKAEKNNTENQKMEELLKIVQQYTEDDFQKIISERRTSFSISSFAYAKKYSGMVSFKKDAKY